MEITNRAHGDTIVVAPAGRVDHATAADFERAVVPLLDAAKGSRAGLVFDLERVTYVSSVGLRVLMIASKKLRARGARVAAPVAQGLTFADGGRECGSPWTRARRIGRTGAGSAARL